MASLQDQALDRLIDFAGEVGLVVLIHNDVDVPFAKPGAEPAYARTNEGAFQTPSQHTFIWAHIGVGRIIRPVKEQAAIIENIINDPQLITSISTSRGMKWRSTSSLRRSRQRTRRH